MRGSRGFTLVELLIVLAIIGVLATLAMANYSHARIRAAETSAIAAMTAINQAQAAYAQTCGHQKFAPRLTSLGKPNPGTNVAFLSPDLTTGDVVEKSGYRIAMEGPEVAEAVVSCTGETPVEAYHVTADPIAPDVSGTRYFGTNGDLVIYEFEESFDGKMPDAGPPPIGQESRGIKR